MLEIARKVLIRVGGKSLKFEPSGENAIQETGTCRPIGEAANEIAVSCYRRAELSVNESYRLDVESINRLVILSFGVFTPSVGKCQTAVRWNTHDF